MYLLTPFNSVLQAERYSLSKDADREQMTCPHPRVSLREQGRVQGFLPTGPLVTAVERFEGAATAFNQRIATLREGTPE